MDLNHLSVHVVVHVVSRTLYIHYSQAHQEINDKWVATNSEPPIN
jgi:hypothetical protein